MAAMAAGTSCASSTGSKLMSKPSAFIPLEIAAISGWPVPPSWSVAAIKGCSITPRTD